MSSISSSTALSLFPLSLLTEYDGVIILMEDLTPAPTVTDVLAWVALLLALCVILLAIIIADKKPPPPGYIHCRTCGILTPVLNGHAARAIEQSHIAPRCAACKRGAA